MVQVTITSGDGQRSFHVSTPVAYQSATIKNILDDQHGDLCIPVPNVNGDTLAKVIEYCEYHVDDHPPADMKAWDAEFIAVDNTMLCDLVKAANFLDITNLLNLCCVTVRDKVIGKTPEEIRVIFDIKPEAR